MRETAVAIVDSGDAQHHFSALERLRERRVGSRHRAVRLDEQHVYADRRRPGARNVAHEVCRYAAWPWPLSQRAERALVDVHDNRRRWTAHQRHQPLTYV